VCNARAAGPTVSQQEHQGQPDLPGLHGCILQQPQRLREWGLDVCCAACADVIVHPQHAGAHVLRGCIHHVVCGTTGGNSSSSRHSVLQASAWVLAVDTLNDSTGKQHVEIHGIEFSHFCKKCDVG